MSMHTSWDVLAEHCKLFVTFGGVPRTARSTPAVPPHHVKRGLYGLRKVRFNSVRRPPTTSTPAARSNGCRPLTPTPR